ncbi:MAG: YchJ family protein [Gammaproteobacteria bacterium]|nr:YchJ family protein [Gammaproteobacteria bacterium]
MTLCPCGSEQNYSNCCEPAHTGTIPSKTAEALMRSRYCAYVKHQISYLGESLHPDHRQDWDEEETKGWADTSEWQSLEILSTQGGQEKDDEGIVEFAATYKENNKLNRHHEISRFQKIDNKWYYVEGSTPKPTTVRNETPKVGRNEPCPCGSGKKYKKCCS